MRIGEGEALRLDAGASIEPARSALNEPGVDEPGEEPSGDGEGDDSLQKLGKDTLVYGLGTVLSRAASFIMLPIYTRYLTPADYGVLELLQLTLDVTSILLSAGVTSGVLRFYFKADGQKERLEIVSTAFLLLAGLNLVGSVALGLSAPWVAEIVLDRAGQGALVRIAAVTFFFEAFVIVPMLLIQARQRPRLYVMASLSKLLLQLGLNIWLVVGLRMGVEGVLLSSLAANVLVGGALVIWMFRITGLRYTRSAMRSLRRYGIPYQLVSAGTFVLTFGDRLVLRGYSGVDEVGIYGLAYKFGFFLVAVGSTPYFRAWSPQRFRIAENHDKEARDRRYNKGFLYLSLLTFTLATAICLYVWPTLRIMSDPEFHVAANIVPVVVAAYVFQILKDVVELGIEVSERTKFATAATWLSVVVTAGLYFLLIPPLDGMGAALATLLGFIVRFGAFYYFSQQLWHVDYRWKRHLYLGGISAAVVAAFYLLRPERLPAQIGLATALLASYVLMTWYLVLEGEERETLVSASGTLPGMIRSALTEA